VRERMRGREGRGSSNKLTSSTKDRMKQASFMRRGWRMSYPVRGLSWLFLIEISVSASGLLPEEEEEDPPDGSKR
jgi:hypothetical protein